MKKKILEIKKKDSWKDDDLESNVIIFTRNMIDDENMFEKS